MTPTTPTEAEITAALITALGQHFWTVPEVWLRDPLSGLSLRVDLIALPKNDAFPLDVIAIEVKRPETQGGEYVQAVKQCIDYKRCVIDDARAKRCRGLTPGAVFLFRGATNHWGLYPSGHTLDARYGVIRLAGKFNVGELLLRNPATRFGLYISDTLVWDSIDGVTGNGRGWLPMRRVGGGRRRAA